MADAAKPALGHGDPALWQACHGGQRRAAERLLAEGADINASPSYASNESALEQVLKPDTRRDLLATWLRERGGTLEQRE